VKILLGMTGSVASTLMPKLAKSLLDAGHDVQIVATEAALYFYDPDQLPKDCGGKELDPFKISVAKEWKDVKVWKDADEWSRRSHCRVVKDLERYATQSYEKGSLVLHIELRKWADVFVIAPLSAHTLAKISHGECDNLLTSVFRAWDFNKPVVLAPAMNTLMWKNPITNRQLSELRAMCGATSVGMEDVCIINPQHKVLACGDEGIGAMAPIEEIVRVVNALKKNTTDSVVPPASE